MSRKLTRRLAPASVDGESGQSIVTLALFSIFFLMVLAIVGDTMITWTQRRDNQNAADSAALAAAQLLPDEGASTTEANSKADVNEAALDGKSVTFGDEVEGFGPTSVTVKVNKSTKSIVGSLGFAVDVPADATARIFSFNYACVVPIGIQASVYATALGEPDEDVILLIDDGSNGQGNPNTQGPNTGLLKLGKGQGNKEDLTDGACDLTPEVDTKPGNSVGVINDGLIDRIKPSVARGCFEWEDVQPPSSGNLDDWDCAPFNSVNPDTGIQETSVILVPILETDIVESNQDYPVDEIDNGVYRLGYFWVNTELTYDTSEANWKCLDGQGTDKCNPIYGRFIFEVPTRLEVFDQDLCPPSDTDCILPFDPDSLFKVVMLVE